jgi:hypothetical protein
MKYLAASSLARLKAIGVNLFMAARVKKVLDAFITAPGTALAGIGSIIWAVKKRFLSPWRGSSVFSKRRLKILTVS